MALVTVAELRAYMSDINFSASQEHVAGLVISGTQQALELHLNRPVQPVQVREKARANAAGDITLSVTPVHKVISIRGFGSDHLTVPSRDVTPLSEEEAERFLDTMPENPMTVPGGVHVGGYGWYVVEYIGGYNGYTDDALKLAILEVASRTMTYEHDDSLTIKEGVASDPPAPSRPKGWTEEELKRLDRLRRRVVYQ